MSAGHDGGLAANRSGRDRGEIGFGQLSAQACDIADDVDGAARLLILRFLGRRAEDVAARAAAEALTGGDWGRSERRAMLALGPAASTNRVAAWVARDMGVGPPAPLVLVVDDDPSIRSVLVDFVVEEMELRVIAAADGAEALARATTARPALVLLDLMMPVLDGFETCRRLRADPRTATIPLVAVSAARRRDEALACGCDDFMAKPFSLEDVETTVRRWLPSA